MYDDYNEFKYNESCNFDLEKNIGIKISESLNSFELKMKNSEIKMLTDLIEKELSKKKEYKCYSLIDKEIDFYTSDIDWDDFLNDVLNYGGNDYALELIKTCHYNLRYLEYISNYPKSNLSYKVVAYNLQDDGFWHIRAQHRNDFKHFRVKIEIKDIIMGILMSVKDLKLYEIMHREILFAPIYK